MNIGFEITCLFFSFRVLELLTSVSVTLIIRTKYVIEYDFIIVLNINSRDISVITSVITLLFERTDENVTRLILSFPVLGKRAVVMEICIKKALGIHKVSINFYLT